MPRWWGALPCGVLEGLWLLEGMLGTSRLAGEAGMPSPTLYGVGRYPPTMHASAMVHCAGVSRGAPHGYPQWLDGIM